jgi:hypothetical protein
MVAFLEGATDIASATLGDAVLAVQWSSPQQSYGPGTSISLVELETGDVRTRTREVDDFFLLLANTADTAWVGEGALISGDERQFERLVRLTITGK